MNHIYANYSFIPFPVSGHISQCIKNPEVRYWYPWLKVFSGFNCYINLSAYWNKDGSFPDIDYSQNVNFYIISGDSGMTGWAEKINSLTGKPVFCMSLGYCQDYPTSDQVFYIPNIYYHKQIEILKQLSQIENLNFDNKKILYKASALTNRISHSKVIIFSALLEHLKSESFLTCNSDTYEEKNLHFWQPTNNKFIDEYINYFKENFLSTSFNITNNFDQLDCSNPAYMQTALNFTQESYNYSYMTKNNKSFIEPGPFLTEKTFKCLLTKTAFIPVGQYKTYELLTSLGMQFDYPFDLSFDNDPGNITRLVALIDLIKKLQNFSAQEIYNQTKNSCDHNYDLIMSNEFSAKCEEFNSNEIEKMYKLVSCI